MMKRIFTLLLASTLLVGMPVAMYAEQAIEVIDDTVDFGFQG